MRAHIVIGIVALCVIAAACSKKDKSESAGEKTVTQTTDAKTDTMVAKPALDAAPTKPPAKTAAHDALVATLRTAVSGFGVRMCACPDRKCAVGVAKDLTKHLDGVTQGADKAGRGEATANALRETVQGPESKQFQACFDKIVSNAPPMKAKVVVAGVRKHADMMCKCKDTACVRERMGEFQTWAQLTVKGMDKAEAKKADAPAAGHFARLRRCFNRHNPKDKQIPDHREAGKAKAKVMAEFAAKMCRCKSKECATKLNREMLVWVEAVFKGQQMKAAAKHVARWRERQKKYADCYTVLLKKLYKK